MHFKLVFYFFSASLLWITTLEICDHHGMLTIISGFIQYQPCNLSSRDFSTQIKIRGAVAVVVVVEAFMKSITMHGL